MYPAIPLQKLVVREVARCCKKVILRNYVHVMFLNTKMLEMVF